MLDTRVLFHDGRRGLLFPRDLIKLGGTHGSDKLCGMSCLQVSEKSMMSISKTTATRGRNARDGSSRHLPCSWGVAGELSPAAVSPYVLAGDGS